MNALYKQLNGLSIDGKVEGFDSFSHLESSQILSLELNMLRSACDEGCIELIDLLCSALIEVPLKEALDTLSGMHYDVFEASLQCWLERFFVYDYFKSDPSHDIVCRVTEAFLITSLLTPKKANLFAASFRQRYTYLFRTDYGALRLDWLKSKMDTISKLPLSSIALLQSIGFE